MVSVIMPTYNGAEYLHRSIGSILNQTHKNFEFVIVDDGSTDRSDQIIKSYSDPRIKYIRQENRGAASAYNTGLKNASSDYIFLMDHDDISLMDRFEKQLKYLEENALEICGSFFVINRKNYQEKKILPIYHEEIREELDTYPWAIFNPTVCFRKKVIQSSGYFNEDYKVAFDYEFYTRNIKYFKCGNIPEYLYIWTFSPKSYGYRTSIDGMKTFKQIAETNLDKKKNFYSRDIYYFKRGLINYYSGYLHDARKYFFKSLLNGNWRKKAISYFLLSSFLSPLLKGMRKNGYFSHPWVVQMKRIVKK